MSAQRMDPRRESNRAKGLRRGSPARRGAALWFALLLLAAPASAGEATTAAPQGQHGAKMSSADNSSGAESSTPAPLGSMDMGSMQGGSAPPDARDPNAYSDGYEYTSMPGRERADQIAFSHVLADELEFLSGNEGEGFGWRVQGNYGGDRHKLWVRTQGLTAAGKTDPTTDLEALWWRAYTPFWGTQLGLRQDFGPGAHTYLAFGVQGLAPYWFEVEATGYVGEDGRVSARFKGDYELLLTNRLILTGEVESNAYSQAEPERGLGAGIGNVELGARLRYEIRRKIAPYAGYIWERSFGGTADRRRADGEPVVERRLVAGARLWW